MYKFEKVEIFVITLRKLNVRKVSYIWKFSALQVIKSIECANLSLEKGLKFSEQLN